MSLKQAELALSTKMLTNEQKQQILAETGLIATENTIQAELLQTTLAQAGLNAEKQNSILKDLGLMNIKTNELLTHKACTKAALEEQLALHGVTGAQAENIISTLGLSGANKSATVSFGLLTKSIWANIKALAAWLVTNPIGWLILAGTAIAGTVALVDALTVSLDEAKENLSNLKDECKNIESELSSMNDELKTTADRMTELENKDKLSFTEKEEYDNLVKNNNELERSIALLELEQKTKNKEKNKSFVQTMQTYDSQVQYAQRINGDIDNRLALTNGTVMGYLTETQYIDLQYKKREEYLQSIEKLTADYNKALTEEEKGRIQSEIDNIELQIDSINSYFIEKSKELTEITSDISYIRNPSTEEDRAVNEWLDYINDFQDKIAIAMGGDKAKTLTFNRLVDNWKFDDIIQGLQNLGKQGQVTADMLNDPKYDEFIQKLVELGVIDSADNLDLIALAFNNFGSSVLDTGEKIENTTNAIDKFKQATEELQTVLDDTFSNQSTIQSAFDKIQKGSSLSADEMLKLISICPELYKTFKKTADGYTVSADDLISANEAITKSAKEEVQNQIEEYRKQAEEYKKQYESALNSGNYSEARNAFSQMEEANKEIGILELKLSAFGLTSERTVKTIEDIDKAIDKLISKTKTLSSAIQEQDEKGQLSADTIMDIVEAGYAEALVYDELTGKVTLNKEAYIEAAKAQYDEQIALLETQIALIETVNSFSELNTGIKNSIGNIFNAAIAFTEFAKSVSTSEEKVSELEGRITALKVARDDVGKYTGSGSNEDTNKKAFDAANDLRKHWITMGKDKTGKKYTEEMYYAWLDSADGYRYYFSDLEKYQDENRQYEEEIYKWRLEQDNKLFEQKLENNEKLIKEIKNGEYDDPIQKYDDLAKATENSLKLVQARINELVASGSGAVQDEIDSLKKQAEELQEDLAEIEKDKLKTRVENEKTFWEQQKEAVETYYDNEIKNLEKIEDEQERINKKEELRLNLIKAQKELLDAKKNRNQLLFADGGFYYDYDQEAVQNAQENVTKAQQDITDFNNDETKRLLEEQRDNEIAYYNTIIEMLEAYINKTLPIESSDSEIFNTAMNSKYAQAVLEKKNNITKPMTPVTLENILQNMGFKYNKEVVSAGYDLLGNVMSNSIKMPFDTLGAYSKMNAQNYTVNNNNNNSVYIENMPVTVPVGTTEEQVQSMIDQFGMEVINAMRAEESKLQ